MADSSATPRRARLALWRRRSKPQRWASVLSGLFTLYLLFGFLLVPVIVKQQLIAQVRQATGRDIAVEAVKFDPLRLALTVNGLNLKEENGESFAGWDSFYVDLEASSLFRRALTFAELRLVKPRVQVRRLSADQFNFTSLLGAATPAPATPEPAPASTMLPAILIQQLSVSDGELVYRDDTHADAPVLKYQSVNFSVTAFSTRAQENGRTRGELTFSGAAGEQFRWQGDLDLPALASSGKIQASGFDMAALSRFAAEALPFRLARGKLDARADYRLTTDAERTGNGFRVKLSDAALTLSGIAIADKAVPDATPIEIAGVQMDGIGLDSAGRTIGIDRVAVNGGKISGILSAAGEFDLLRLFTSAPAAAAEPSPATAGAKPWLTTFAKASLDGFRIELTDQGPSPPVTLALDPLRVTLEDFRSDNSQPIEITIDSGVNGGGRLRISGPVSRAPVQATLNIEADKIPLAGFQPYLSQAINIQLHSGVASTAGTLTYPETGQGSGLSYRGDVGIDDLHTTDNRFDREFLSWKRLAVKNLHFQQAANRTTIDSVEFNQLYGRFAIRADGTTNVEKLLVTAPETVTPSGPATPPAPASPMAIVINRVAIVDSAAYFADLTMTPDFRVGIFNLKGAIKNIDSGSGKPIAVDLVGQVDRYAPVTIAGLVDPFKAAPTLDMKLAFKNLEMTTLTPYSGVYAGHRIKQGQLSVDLHYQLDNGQVLGQNHIVMNQMELGERVESPKATDLPLRLALALLKDSKGVIDLGLEVKGNINAPDFSVGGLVFMAFKNLIVKAVSAPFKLIAGLVGGGEDSGPLDAIAFAPGSEQLDAREKAKLDQLVKALAERPRLRLDVTGNTLPVEDSKALAQVELDHQLGALFSGGADGNPQWPGMSAAVANRNFRQKFYALYETTTGESAKTRRKLIDSALSEGDRKPTDAEIDSALHEHIQHELLAREEVPEKALSALASQRALTVKAYLVDSGGLPPDRVFLVSDGAAGQPALNTRLTLNAL